MRNTRLDNVISFIGRKNSGKTTLVEQVISELAHRGVVVSSLKHHGHDDFEIDVPGKDSYRHHEAGTLATAIASATRYALVEDLPSVTVEEDLTNVEALLRSPSGQAEAYEQCIRAIGMLPASNLVVIEGFKRAGLPAIELFRQDNPRDVEAAPEFVARVNDFIMNGAVSKDQDDPLPAAVVSDIPEVIAAALTADLPYFSFYEIAQIATWINDTFAKPLLSVAIQAGGESRRMKESKALASFHGRPLIEHIIARVAPISADLVVTTNEPESLRYLQLLYPGLRLVPDKYRKRGALPGFITALEAARYPVVAVVACDLVNLPVELIEHEAQELIESQTTDLFLPVDAVVPMTSQGYEPFCGVYQKERALEAAIASWDKRKVRMRNVLELLNVRYLNAESDPRCTPESFRNVNTRDDLSRAQGISN